jgi:hypothetical protein
MCFRASDLPEGPPRFARVATGLGPGPGESHRSCDRTPQQPTIPVRMPARARRTESVGVAYDPAIRIRSRGRSFGRPLARGPAVHTRFLYLT